MNKKWLTWVFKIIITGIFVYFVNRKLSWHELTDMGAYLTVGHLVAAFICCLAGLFFQVKRWEIILRYQNFSIANNIALKTILWGNVLAFITPGRIGEIFRGLEINTHRRSDSILAVVVDKLFITLAVLFTGLIGILLQMLFVATALTTEMKQFVLAATITCAIAIAIALSPKVRERAGVFTHFITSIFKSLPRLFNPAGQRAIFYSFAAHGVLLCQTFILLHMFGVAVSLPVCIAIAQAYGVMLFFSFTIGNMGVREGSFYYFLSHLGVTALQGAMSLKGLTLGVSLIILLMNLVLPAMAGMLWYFSKGFVNDQQGRENA